MRLLLVLLLALPLHAAEVRVFAAASLTEALTEIGRSYEKQTGDRLTFNFGASSILARQIDRGARADLFLSADEATMNRVRTVARASVLSNQLVIVVPRDRALRITHPRQLVGKRIALAEPSSVPAGIYARTWLTRLGLWKAVAPRVVPTENVRGALAAVASGNVDAAIVYRTDARISQDVRVAYAVTDGPKISYPFAILTNTAHARRFFAYLRAKPALDVFAKHGFDVLR